LPTTDVIIDEQVFGRWYKLSDKMLQQCADGSAVVRRNPDGSSSVLAVVGKYDVLSEHFEEATMSKDPQFGPIVAFKMTKSGAKQLGEITGNYMPDFAGNMKFRLGIFVDDELISAPNINDRITSSGQITGNFNQADVDQIAAIMNSGGIPIHLILESESNP
jgi:SecD/SecF fusion protein